MSGRFVCVHGHFYQPPRENPWLESIELQESAAPDHDWNVRINRECYAPNAASRILDGEERIASIVNNYAKISFNFGPTLLTWLESQAPDVYRALLEADERSIKAFSGHGSALAQAYNHVIMPLAPRRDKVTQVLWGLRDFERRFRRKAEGMWLPETAVDLETLDVLAEHGVRFTVLSQRQARRWRRSGSRQWQDPSQGAVDPTVPYEVRLPSGRRIAVFFYDDAVSRGVAFEGLLSSGERFAQRLLAPLAQDRPGARLVSIATDGETYGHHHRYGDMALAYALRHIEAGGQARLTNYGEFLERFPPADEAEIVENSSWSCAHGVERWRSDCGCSSGGRPGWRQAWRGPLREALDWLRDSADPSFEAEGAALFKDPWAAREAYISVMLDRSRQSVDTFLRNHGRRSLAPEEERRALKLCELQRQMQLMYTSCGWFFDDISGIETVQVLQYAARALQLARELFGADLEPRFLERLQRAPSNLPELRDGRGVYERLVRPAVVDLRKVAAHYAISSLFEGFPPRARVFCYEAERRDYRLLRSGKARLAVGRGRFASEITRESAELAFGVLHLADHNVSAVVREFASEEEYDAWAGALERSLADAELPEIIRRVDRCFGPDTFTLKSLFRDGQRRIVEAILDGTLAETERAFRRLYDGNAAVLRFLSELSIPLPPGLHAVAELALNAALRREVEAAEPDPEAVRAHLEEIRRSGVRLDSGAVAGAFKRALERLARELRERPEDHSSLRRLRRLLELARSLPLVVPLWHVQNAYYALALDALPRARRRADGGDARAGEWVEDFLAAGVLLKVRAPDPAELSKNP